MSFLLKSLTATSILPAAAVTSSPFFLKPLRPNYFALSLKATTTNTNFSSPPPQISLRMDSLTSAPAQKREALPELLTEFMVDMKCDSCVNAVKNKLLTVEDVKRVEVDLSNQVVCVVGSSPVKAMADALEETGRKARLIGQGKPEGGVSFLAIVPKLPSLAAICRRSNCRFLLLKLPPVLPALLYNYLMQLRFRAVVETASCKSDFLFVLPELTPALPNSSCSLLFLR
ncbi:hypothetical protein GIB67_019059 [Kingdonia uniflora]|uniref:HMA domain-containing protein n=1 Tax=Kingdonia uniflora TaxID=39325 RepID=A0A7J7MZU2_9MAGN|nr:hypothetical protein GIB67_019059 [Kingdonia uniflora]